MEGRVYRRPPWRGEFIDALLGGESSSLPSSGRAVINLPDERENSSKYYIKEET
jgi:hypothetical protein